MRLLPLVVLALACGPSTDDPTFARSAWPDAAPLADSPDAIDVGDPFVPAGTTDTATAAPELSLAIEVDVALLDPLRPVLQTHCQEPVRLMVAVSGPGMPEREAEAALLRTEHVLDMALFRADSTYDITVTAIAPDGRTAAVESTFTTGPLPEWLQVPYLVTTDGEDRGLTLLALPPAPRTGPGPRYAVVDAEGHILWAWLDLEGGGAGRIFRHEGDGQLFMMASGATTSTNLWGDIHWRLTSEELGGERLHHEVRRLPNGNLIALGDERDLFDVDGYDEPVTLIGDTILELRTDGTRVSKWSSFEHLDTSRFPGELSRTLGPGGTLDWTHSNALAYRADDDLLMLSVRHQDHVVGVERTTGAVRWILGQDGDFELTEGSWFASQHAPAFLDDGLVLYDNGNERVGPEPLYTRIVRYELDEIGMTARQVYEWRLPFYTRAMGDVDVLADGRFLVTAGGADKTATGHIYEVDEEGVVRWELAIPDAPLYRAERTNNLPWLRERTDF